MAIYVYTPSKHTLTSKSLGISTGSATDARSMYYDEALFLQRPYQSVEEVIGTLNTATKRKGCFPIFIHTGILNSNGTFSYGNVEEWWFRNGTADVDLVKKYPITDDAAIVEYVITGSDIPEGTQVSYKLFARYEDQTEKDVSTLATWTASEGSFVGTTLYIPTNTNTTDGNRPLTVTAKYNGVTTSEIFTIFDTTPTPEEPDVPTEGKYTVQSGNWNATTTWNNGVIPVAGDEVNIVAGHTVVLTTNVTLTKPLWIRGTLEFKADSTITLTMDNKSIIVLGRLKMNPAAHQHVHTVKFINVDESTSQGGGMSYSSLNADGTQKYQTDIGVFGHDMGKIDLIGTYRKRWTEATGSVPAGATVFTVKDATGWQIDDEIFIVPMGVPDYNVDSGNKQQSTKYNATTKKWEDLNEKYYEKRTITAVNGNTITVNTPFTYAHNAVVSTISNKHASQPWVTDKTWLPEVGNLTANVRVMGEEFGKVHMLIHSHTTQFIRNASFRFMGQRKIMSSVSSTVPMLVSGRYVIHFHHGYFATVGSEVTDCAVYDCFNRSFVPHESHGIKMNGNLAFNCLEAMFWWDKAEPRVNPNTGQNWKDSSGNDIIFANVTHETQWVGNLMAMGKWNTLNKGYTAMLLSKGDGNIANENHYVGVSQGNYDVNGGIEWDEGNEGIWIYRGNVAHSMQVFMWVWQNTTRNHTNENNEAFHCKWGIYHGAYVNAYTYIGGHFYNAPARIAATGSAGQSGNTYMRITFNAAGLRANCIEFHEGPIPTTDVFVRVLQCTFRGFTYRPVRLFTKRKRTDDDWARPRKVDVVMCDANVADPINQIYIDDYTEEGYRYYMYQGAQIRVQPITGQSYQILMQPDSVQSVTAINKFNPTVWGTGRGLLGSYYWTPKGGTEELLYTRKDDLIYFDSNWRVTDSSYIENPTGVNYRFFEREKVLHTNGAYYISGNYFNMRVKWEGFIEAQYSEIYNFIIRSACNWKITMRNLSTNVSTVMNHTQFTNIQTGALKGAVEVSSWAESNTFVSPGYAMTAGQKYAIEIEIYETGGNRGFGIMWKCPSMAVRDMLPLFQCYTPDHPDVQ